MKKLRIILKIIAVLSLTSCADDFLEVNRDKKIVVPKTIKDYRALIDYTTVMNGGAGLSIAATSDDDYYIKPERFAQLYVETDRNAYVWNSEIYEGAESYDWNRSYARILYANSVLEGLEKIEDQNNDEWRNVKGSALFHRSSAFYSLAILFADVYRPGQAEQTLGIPLRTTTDITVHTKRATLQETYDKIIGDLLLAVELLPLKADVKVRPSKTAAYALLARCYLQMEDYEKAYLYADSAFAVSDGLMDYNDIDFSLMFPFPKFNKEVIFSDASAMTAATNITFLNIDSNLYDSYDNNDLRKEGFFFEYAGNHAFSGSYDGSAFFFVGLTASEVLLIRAEAALRLGDADQARADLNLLLKHRYSDGQVEKIAIMDHDKLLEKLLLEKRKETLFRGIRWSELKRLNKDPETSKTLRRVIGDDIFELKPNDKKYIMPIPDNAVSLGHIQQNERL